MIDPDFPTKLKSADAGIYRLVCDLGENDVGGDNVVIVDTHQSYHNWRFELTEDWASASTTAAGKLLNWDGTTFADTVTLSDPDSVARGLPTGSTGYCHHRGNAFEVYSGGSGGGALVEFAITAFAAGVATCTVAAGDPTLIGTSIDVIDNSNGLFNETPTSDLIGRYGWAHRTYTAGNGWHWSACGLLCPPVGSNWQSVTAR